VEAALPVIDDGDAVLVHCLAGVHRSVAMACCVLIGMGYSAEEAMQLVESKREVADPRVWYIRARIEKFERSWRARHPGGRLAAGG
jgi:protein-tyrosine phosphatase